MPALLVPRPAAARLRDRAVDLVGLITTPLLPADYLDLVSPLRAGAELRGRIVAIHPETRDAATLVIRPGRGWARHVPGQYIRIGVDVDGVRQWRAYSLTSPVDRSDGCVAITVKAIPDGRVSTHLVRRARIGMLVQLDQACGEFVLPHPRPAKVLFVTAGSGITPVMGMLRNALDELGNVVVVHSAPTAADVIFAGELRMLAARGRITLVEQHTDTDGMLDPEQLADLVGDLDERETWACGPAGMLDGLEHRWAERGIPERLHTERFRATAHATGDGGTVTFTTSEIDVDADGATSLLDAGERAGVLMPSGCRMGICFGCVAPLREGAVRDLRNGELTTASSDDGPARPVLVQTCISAAAGRCEIEL
ncbi:MAG: ferredoxin reductase [Solirubrobacteraceae bacterium]